MDFAEIIKQGVPIKAFGTRDARLVWCQLDMKLTEMLGTASQPMNKTQVASPENHLGGGNTRR